MSLIVCVNVTIIAATGYAGWRVVRRGGGTLAQGALAGLLFSVITVVLQQLGWRVDARVLDEPVPHVLNLLFSDWGIVAGKLLFFAAVGCIGGLIARTVMRRRGEDYAPGTGKQVVRIWRTVANGLLRNLGNGIRIALCTDAEPDSRRVSPGQWIALLAVNLAVVIVLERILFNRGEPVFYWPALRYPGTGALIGLLTGWLTIRLATRRVSLLLVPVAITAVTFLIVPVEFGAYYIARYSHSPLADLTWPWIYLGVIVWFFLVMVLFVHRATGMRSPRVAAVMLPLIALAIYDYRFPMYFWYEAPASAPTRAYNSPAAEKFLYLEPRIARQEIAALRPHTGRHADTYFVGFAPDADQDVFMNEVEAIRRLMDHRFGTRGRSLLLINNRKTLGHYPLATVTNLRSALRHIGAVMDRNKDVLVLYLTSHGSPSFHLFSDFWPLRLEEINPILLRHLLDESGIKWRVIIVSACYSGGFIAPLRGPTTLVMTAADATHTSFGCSAHGKYTYFGRALFGQELRRTYSFRQAFEWALPVIRAREKRLGDGHSNPQIAEGNAIRLKLARMDRRLEAIPKPTERIVANSHSQ